MAYIGSKPANKPVVASDIDPTVITGQTALGATPVDTDEFLVSDAGVLKRMDYSHIKAGGAWTYLNTVTISSSTASASFDGDFTSDYDVYKILFNIAPVALSSIRIRFRKSDADDTSSNYQWVKNGGRSNDASGGWVVYSAANQDTDYLEFSDDGDDGDAMVGEVTLFDPLNTSYYKNIIGVVNTRHDNGRNLTATTFGSLDDDTAALSGITFYQSTGNIAVAKFRLYGIKNS
jgi:hypothetical protein